MVEIAEIKDRDSLQEWLEALPFDTDENRRIAVTIAHRAAMRVMPVFWLEITGDYSKLSNALPVLRSVFKSGVFGSRPSKDIALAAYDSASGEKHGFTEGAKNAEMAAFLAADSADGPTILSATSSVSCAVSPFIDSPGGATLYVMLMWSEVRRDCLYLEEGKAILDQVPLWSENNPLEKRWQNILLKLPKGWEFWRDWYQNALDGIKPNWDMLTEIALIDPADWDKGPDHVNGLIAGIVEEFRTKDAKPPEPVTNKYPELTSQAKHAIAQRVQFNRGGLALSLAGVLEQIATFREKIRGLNGLEPKYRDDLLDFLDELSGSLDELLHAIPDENEEISEEKATLLAEWWQSFQPLAVNKAKAYVSPENVADAAIPSGIILGCAGIGGIVGGPFGVGAGAYVGGLITGYVKPNKAVDELLKQSSDTQGGD